MCMMYKHLSLFKHSHLYKTELGYTEIENGYTPIGLQYTHTFIGFAYKIPLYQVTQNT